MLGVKLSGHTDYKPTWTGAPCTCHGLHFHHIFTKSLQIFSLQQLRKCNLHLQQVWQSIIFIFQQARYLGSSHLHSSMQVGTNLCLPAKITIFKSSRKPAGSPKVQYLAPPTNFVGGVFLIDTGTEPLLLSLDQVQVSKSLDVCDLHVALVLPPSIGVTKVAQTVGIQGSQATRPAGSLCSTQ